jgi:cupin 2 domain-containing protein
MDIQSLFADLPNDPATEQFSTLLQTANLHLVRIVSTGHSTPDDEWYDQAENEWVLVLRGSAEIRFPDEGGSRTLGPGDYLHIPAHARHRVDWTDPDQPTVWLALHYG